MTALRMKLLAWAVLVLVRGVRDLLNGLTQELAWPMAMGGRPWLPRLRAADLATSSMQVSKGFTVSSMCGYLRQARHELLQSLSFE